MYSFSMVTIFWSYYSGIFHVIYSSLKTLPVTWKSEYWADSDHFEKESKVAREEFRIQSNIWDGLFYDNN